jgi:flagellar basal body rod protein FlgG
MDGIELMATAMRSARARLDVSAGNLANVSTDGFARRVARARLTAQGLVASSTRDPREAPLKHTGRSLDLAVAGPGGFFVRASDGRAVVERSGSFERDSAGRLVDERGRELLGANGALRVRGEVTVDARGLVRDDAGRLVGSVRVQRGTAVESGFLEASNVDAIGEMVDVLSAQRDFETAQKTLSALDDVRGKLSADVARVKS